MNLGTRAAVGALGVCRGIRGFTLIELLVTTVLIGALAGILLPAAANAKNRSRQIRCLSNTRMLTMAAIMYGIDNGRRPGYENPSLPAGVWMGTLAAEIKSDDARICPATVAPDDSRPGDDTDGNAGTEWARWTSDRRSCFRGSYGFNGWLYSDGSVDGDDERARNVLLFFGRGAESQKASDIPVFFDENWVDQWPMEQDQPPKDLFRGASFYDQNNELGRCAIARHGAGALAGPRSRRRGAALPGAVNVAMADGHAASIRLADLWKLTWHQGWETPAWIPGL